jgi:MraZ protein
VDKSGSKLKMFRGINSVIVDAKGRMAMPMRYRVQLLNEVNGRFVVTIDTEEKCLLLYPLPVWEEIEKKIESLPSFNKITRRIQRLLIGHATELEMDGSGRLLLPPLLREYASLDKRVMLVGQGKKFEIWDEAIWTGGRENWLASGLSELPALPTELQNLSL